MDQIMHTVSEYLAIILPALTYIISGIVAIVKLSSIAKSNKSDIQSTNTTVEAQNTKIDQLTASNADLQKQIKRLCNKIDKIQDTNND
jgi:peptidoglycan hydrolase CwlO-like protein